MVPTHSLQLLHTNKPSASLLGGFVGQENVDQLQRDASSSLRSAYWFQHALLTYIAFPETEPKENLNQSFNTKVKKTKEVVLLTHIGSW